MYNVAAAETWFMLGVICLSGAIANLIALIMNTIIKNSKVFFCQNRFVLICVLLSGVIVSGAVMINCTPWQVFFTNIFFANIHFYIILALIIFLIVLFSHYAFIIACVIYILYSSIAWFTIHSECMDSNTSFPVTVYKDSGSITVSYFEFSPHLLLPFARTWIAQIDSNNVATKEFKMATIRGPLSLVSKLLWLQTSKKQIVVPVSAARLPPETWELALKRQNGEIQYTFKRLL